MSEKWQDLKKQLDIAEEEIRGSLDLELNSCLLVMVRYLVQKDRMLSQPSTLEAMSAEPDNLRGD